MPPPVCIACERPLGTPVTLRSQDRLYGLSSDIYEVAVCEHCGAGTTLPIVGEDELPALYPSHYSAYQAPTSSTLSRALALFMRMRYMRTLAKAPYDRLGAPARALDVGCGRGELGAALVRRGWQVDGVEPSAAACAIARLRGVDAHDGTLSTVDLTDAHYAVVIFSHSLEHVVAPRDALQKAFTLLERGGLVIVSVPDFASWQSRFFGSAWFGLDLPRHRAHFTAAALSAMALAAGLEVLGTSTSSSAVGLPGSVQYRLFGHCMFRDGPPFYLANAFAIAVSPLSRLVDRVRGGGDYLHFTARRPVA